MMNADDPPKLTGLTVQQMMDRVRDDFQEKQYYVTGNFSSELFTDEYVCFTGRTYKCHTKRFCATVCTRGPEHEGIVDG